MFLNTFFTYKHFIKFLIENHKISNIVSSSYFRFQLQAVHNVTKRSIPKLFLCGTTHSLVQFSSLMMDYCTCYTDRLAKKIWKTMERDGGEYI